MKGKILIIEDELIFSSLMKDHLEDCGYCVVGPVSNGPDAVLYTENERPDMILMDINLSGPFDGVEAANRIKLKFDIPIIYITGNSDELTRKRADITNPIGYLIKPVDVDELSLLMQKLFAATS